MNWQNSVARLRERLPELERQVFKFGAFFPLSLLPVGLFRDVSSGDDCIHEIAKDLNAIRADTPDCIIQYWSIRLSQKIHVLVHICRTHSHQQKDPSKDLDTIGTYAQYLANNTIKHQKLSQQRQALLATLETMRLSDNSQAVLVLKKEIYALDVQIADFESTDFNR